MALTAVMILIGTKAVRTRIVQSLVVLLVPLVTGGYWYSCNALLTGNPLYPLDVRVLGHTLLPGWYGPEAMRFSPYYIALLRLAALGDTLLAVLDPRLVPLWALSVVGGWVMKNSNVAGLRHGWRSSRCWRS